MTRGKTVVKFDTAAEIIPKSKNFNITHILHIAYHIYFTEKIHKTSMRKYSYIFKHMGFIDVSHIFYEVYTIMIDF